MGRGREGGHSEEKGLKEADEFWDRGGSSPCSMAIPSSSTKIDVGWVQEKVLDSISH